MEKERRLQRKNFCDVSIVSGHFWTFREFNYEHCCEIILLPKEQKNLIHFLKDIGNAYILYQTKLLAQDLSESLWMKKEMNFVASRSMVYDSNLLNL